MEYNPPKLFKKILCSIDKEIVTVHDLLNHFALMYTNENGGWGCTYIDDWKKGTKVEFDDIEINLSEVEYKKLCSEALEIVPIEFLKRLNLYEFNKFSELIDHYSIEKKENLKGDSDVLEVLDAKIKSLNKFKKVFMKWFVDWNISIPITEIRLSDNAPLHEKQLEREYLTKTQFVKLHVDFAREDKSIGSDANWKNKIFSEFGDGMYAFLNRIKANFIKEHPKEKFNINGMAWYNKS